MPLRYAIYYIPPRENLLCQRGAQLLGRDVYSGTYFPHDAPHALSSALQDVHISPKVWHVLTEDARKYGLHATLKPPFTLAQGRSEAELKEQFTLFSQKQQAFTLPPLHIQRMSSFFALRPQDTHTQAAQNMQQLAQDVVTFFEPFREPLSAQALQRRRDKAQGKLTERQEEHLCRWGYPYVFEEFHFHISLCNAHEEIQVNEQILQFLHMILGNAPQNLLCHGLALCKSDTQGIFSVIQTHNF